MAGCLGSYQKRAKKAARAVGVATVAVFLPLLIILWSCAPAFAAVTPIVLESKTAGGGTTLGPNYTQSGPATTTAKSSAAPLANWSGGWLMAVGSWYASQANPAKWGQWAFTPAAGRGGYYDVYLTWANNVYVGGFTLPSLTIQNADPDVIVQVNQATGGNQWNLMASSLKYDAEVTKTVRLQTNPDAVGNKRTYFDSVAFAPCVPTAPTPTSPADGATGVPSSGGGNELTWTPGTGNYRFDVYLSTGQADVENKEAGALAASDLDAPTYDPDGSLTPNATYYWRVVAKNLGETVDGPVWSFSVSGFVASVDPQSWTNANSVTVTFDASAAMPLLDHYEIALDGGAYTEQVSPYVLDVSLVADGTHTVHVKAVNDLDDEITRDLTIYLDKTGPLDFVPTANPAGYTGSPFVELTFATTDALSGMDRYEVALDEGAFAERTSPHLLDVGAAADGTHTAHIRAYDVAGNYTEKDATVLVDKTAPNAFTPTADPATWTNAATVQVTFATTDDLSGIHHYEVGVNGANFALQTSPHNLSTAGLPDGAHTVNVIAFDGAQNQRSASVPIQIDKSGPQIISCTSPAARNGTSIIVTYAVADDHSQLKNVALWYKKGAGGVWTDSTLVSTETSGNFLFEGTTGDDTYYFGLVAEDNVGNQTTTNSGEGSCSTVLDNTLPNFTSIAASPGAAKVGTAVTLTFTASEQLGGNPTVRVNGNAATYVGASGLDYTYTYTIVSGDAEGFADIYVEGADLAGNTNFVDDLTQLLIDKTAPLAFTPTADPPSYTNAATIQITFATTDALSGLDHYLLRVDGGSFTTETSPYTLSTAGLSDGGHLVEVYALDAAGNQETSGVWVYVDKSAPQIVSCTSPATANGASIPVTFTVSDPGSGIKDSTLWYKKGSGGTWTSAGVASNQGTDTIPFWGATGDDTYYFGLVVEDNLGNITSTNSGDGSCQTVLDTAAPTFGSIDALPQAAKPEDVVTITFTASEPLNANPTVTVNGDAAAFVSIDGLNYTYSYTVQSDDTEGNADICLQGVDVAGNSNTTHDLTQLLIDKTAPVDFIPTADPASWTAANSIAIGFFTTDALSGIGHYEVALDGGAYSTQTSPYSLDVSATSDGTHTVHVKAIDGVGNELIRDVTIYLDKSAPLTFTPTADPAGWTNANSVSISFSATDTGSGINHYEVALDGGAYSTQASPYALDVSGVADGVHTVHVKAVDNLSNELVRDVSIYLDKTGPLPFIPVSNPAIWYSYTGAGNVTMTWATSDAHSGVHHYEVALNAGAYTTQASPYVFSAEGFTPGTYTLHIRAHDAAGNTTTVDYVTEVSADGTPPTAALTFTDPDPTLGRDFDYVFWKNWMGVTTALQNTYNINWTAQDDQTGVASVVIEYRANPDDPWILLHTTTELSGTVPFDVSSMTESNAYQFRIRAVDHNNNWAAEQYTQFGVYDATKLAPTAKVVSPANGSYLKLGSTVKIRVQETMPVFTDPRDPTKAYKDSARDWWYAGHTLTATPQLREYKRKSDGRPTALRKTLLASILRLAPQSVVNTNTPQVAQYLGYVIVNTWETNYTLRRGVVSTSDVFQVEQKYSDFVSIGNVRQPDKPNVPGMVLPSTRQEPLINTLKQYEFSRFWVR